MAGKKGVSGAPKSNLNSTRNGSKLSRLVLGDLPSGMHRQLQVIRKYRRTLEDSVIEIKGFISLGDAHLINEAATGEQHGAICRWLLRNRLGSMSVSDITKCSEQILKSKTVRNRAVKELKLDAEPASPWAIIDVTPKGTDA
jgi:hypothetical protein